MKNLSSKILLVLLLCAIAVIIMSLTTAKVDAINWGHWVYTEQGVKNGCVSPGTDCTWSRN